MEEFKGDKRTKAYRKYKAKFEREQSKKAKGLGDVVEKITEATGIKSIVKAIAGDDCGCDERKERWNKKYKFKYTNCLTPEQFEYMTVFLDTKKNRVSREDQKALVEIYNYVFNAKRQLSSCPSCIKNMIQKLEVVMSI